MFSYPEKLKRKLKIATLIILSWFLIHCIYTIADGLNRFAGKADVAIVLGTIVRRDGSVAPILQGRLDKALLLYKKNLVKKIVVSGEDDAVVSQGEAMKKYLVEHGVDSNDIFVDNLGDNTYLTAKNFIKLNKQHSFSSAVVVTNFYHITRCKYIFKKLGYKNISGNCSERFTWRDDLNGILREFAAFYKYMIVY